MRDGQDQVETCVPPAPSAGVVFAEPKYPATEQQALAEAQRTLEEITAVSEQITELRRKLHTLYEQHIAAITLARTAPPGKKYGHRPRPVE